MLSGREAGLPRKTHRYLNPCTRGTHWYTVAARIIDHSATRGPQNNVLMLTKVLRAVRRSQMDDSLYRSHFERRPLRSIVLALVVFSAICFVLLNSSPTLFSNAPPYTFNRNYLTTASLNMSTSVDKRFLQKPDHLIYRHNLHDNVSWTRPSQVTDAKKTSVHVMTSEMKVGDQMWVRIVARDSLGNLKSYGGDYIRIKLSSDETRSYVNPDYILDFGNGTYDAYFTLRWPGLTQVDALLVHPSEAVSVINRLIQNMPNRLAYDGLYTHPSTKKEETTRCGVVFDSQGKYCNYSDPRSFAPWYCEKPKTPGMKCNNLPRLCFNLKRSKRMVDQHTTPLEIKAIDRLKIPIGNKSVSFTISEVDSFFKEPPQLCQLTTIPNDMSTRGFFYKDAWHPFHCKIRLFSVKETLVCLRNTHIYMLGDSTIRQFEEYFVDKVKGFKDVTKNKGKFILSPRHFHNPDYNITVKYRSHGPPLKTPCQPLDEIRYVFNELDKISGGPDVIVFISLWAHFGKTTLHLYEKRIEAILDSVERHLERFPETTVIFKGGNTRSNENSFWTICSSDWVAYRFEEKLRSILSSRNLNIKFLDAWDLTTAHYSVDSTHPNDHIISTMMNQVLTQYCK